MDKVKIDHLLSRGVEEVTERQHLEAALSSGKQLRVKHGIDPTAPDLHLGHAVVLRKLKEFQDLGHKVVLIFGDFTVLIGDPSGRDKTRPMITVSQAKENMKDYLAQAAKVLDIKKTEIRYNSEWFTNTGVQEVIELSSAGSLQQVLKRADFKKRLGEGSDITVLELLYPLFQGYDSVAVKADVEVGGSDQLFNLLMGRRVQRHYKMPEQDVMTVPLLEGLDGARKMSKSYGNYVGLSDTPDNMFGKLMSVPDKLAERYFLLCTDLDESEVKKLKKELSPRDFKARLGFEVVKLYHSEAAARAAEEKFTSTFSKGEAPADAPELKLKKGSTLLDLVLTSSVVKSKSEARRLIEQGGVSVNNNVIKDPSAVISAGSGETVKIGKKNFFRIKI